MTIARSAADVLDDHVTMKIDCIDRMYLNVYQPRLQHELGVVGFFKEQGYRFVSSALMDPMTKRFVAGIHRFVSENDVALVDFVPGQRKDDVAQQFLAEHDGSESIVFVGRAQEKASVFRTEKRVNSETGATYPWLVRRSSMVNHFYFYGFDSDFGPFFIKFCTYFPYGIKVCINGHHWAQQQGAQAGLEFVCLDNGFAKTDNEAGLQEICDSLDATKIERFIRKWLKILPNPFSDSDRAAGFGYDISILQSEFSTTHVLDQPLSGRIFFEEVIRENLDSGRPSQVSLIFEKRAQKNTPGKFRTRVIHSGVMPSLHVDYKTSKIKQYHKEGCALRTETTINNTRDFGIGKRLQNLPALREVGLRANRQLLATQRISRDPIRGERAFGEMCSPIMVGEQRVAGLRFDAARTQALLSVLLSFCLLPNGFSNKDLRHLLAPLLGLTPESLTCGQMTYDLRRLKLHGLIERIPHTHRYRVTDKGIQSAITLTTAWRKLVREPLADVTESWPTPLRRAYERFDAELTAHATS